MTIPVAAVPAAIVAVRAPVQHVFRSPVAVAVVVAAVSRLEQQSQAPTTVIPPQFTHLKCFVVPHAHDNNEIEKCNKQKRHVIEKCNKQKRHVERPGWRNALTNTMVE